MSSTLVEPVGRWDDYPQSRIRSLSLSRAGERCKMDHSDRRRDTRPDDNSSYTARLVAEGPVTVGRQQGDAHIAEIGVY